MSYIPMDTLLDSLSYFFFQVVSTWFTNIMMLHAPAIINSSPGRNNVEQSLQRRPARTGNQTIKKANKVCNVFVIDYYSRIPQYFLLLIDFPVYGKNTVCTQNTVSNRLQKIEQYKILSVYLRVRKNPNTYISQYGRVHISRSFFKICRYLLPICTYLGTCIFDINAVC